MLILPSKNEGQPYVILEAIAAGLPIIATNVGCVPEMVQDGLNGFLIEPGDIEALAEKICVLLTDDALRRKMGQASRERFLAEFTFDKFAERMRAVFAAVLEERHADRLPGSYKPSQDERAPVLTDQSP